MADGPIYVLDANVFIQAARRYYAFDIVPAFWQALENHAADERVLSIDRVRQELDRGKDELANWAKVSFHEWFASTDDTGVIQAYAELMQWAQAQKQYLDAAKEEFASDHGADAWLVAYAKARGCTIVTHEQVDPRIKRKIPIPNVCQAFGLSYLDTFEMLRALGVRLGGR